MKKLVCCRFYTFLCGAGVWNRLGCEKNAEMCDLQGWEFAEVCSALYGGYNSWGVMARQTEVGVGAASVKCSYVECRLTTGNTTSIRTINEKLIE